MADLAGLPLVGDEFAEREASEPPPPARFARPRWIISLGGSPMKTKM